MSDQHSASSTSLTRRMLGVLGGLVALLGVALPLAVSGLAVASSPTSGKTVIQAGFVAVLTGSALMFGGMSLMIWCLRISGAHRSRAIRIGTSALAISAFSILAVLLFGPE